MSDAEHRVDDCEESRGELKCVQLATALWSETKQREADSQHSLSEA